MPDLGNKLKRAREKQGLSPREVEEKLKIRNKYITALEEEDFTVMPDKKFAQEVVLAYAELLNLDSKKVAGEFERAWVDANKAKAYIKDTFFDDKKIARFKYGKLTTALVAVLLIAVIFFFANNNIEDETNKVVQGTQDNEKAAFTEETLKPAPETGDKEDTTKENADTTEGIKANSERAPEAEQQLKLEISTPRGDCWLEVEVDGKRVVYRTVKQGADPLVFEGKEEIKVVFGNAAAVDVIINGRKLEQLGDFKEVVRKTFTPKE